jgi:seryl-tRNA synthetase
MLDINLIRSKPDFVREQLLKRMSTVDFGPLLSADREKRKIQAGTEELRARRNSVTAEIAALKKSGKDAGTLIADMKALGDQIAADERRLTELEQQIFDIISAFPNIPADDVAAGGKENNRVVKTFGARPAFKFKPKDHMELCTALGLIDYERAAKISGAGTWVYTGTGAILEWALLNYFVDFHIANGYKFMLLPHLLNYESGYAAGQFPKFTEDVFFTNFDADPKKSKFLLPTAETALINLHRGEIIGESALPVKYAGFTPCYRKEAGSYRTSERGMIRGYQFNKVEMFIFCKSADSAGYFAELVANAEKLVDGLGLHFQTVALAAGDCSAGMAKTYDIEVFLPSMNEYKEVSSVSNAHDYQARRANIKTKTAAGNELVHTLNASGLATSRLIPAIVEQFQNEDGSVTVPKALQKYMHGIVTLKKV